MTKSSDLLELALTQPRLALAMATERLRSQSDPTEQSVVERAIGNAHRELREVGQSLAALHRSIDHAVDAHDSVLEGLAVMSLAATESYTGNFGIAFELMDRAETLLTGDDYLLALNQRAGLLQRAGRGGDAIEVFERALGLVETSGIPWIEGSLRLNRGVLFGYRGLIDDAIVDTRRAMAIFEAEGWSKRAADMVHNLAWLAGRKGDVVGALRLFDEAETRYAEAGVDPSGISPDRCEVLMIAGLYREAFDLATRSAHDLEASGDAIDFAEALVLVARAASAGGDLAASDRAATRARDIFAESNRRGWAAAAEILLLEAKLAEDRIGHFDLVAANDLVEQLRAGGLDGASAQAAVVAADIELSVGSPADVLEHLSVIDLDLLDPASLLRQADIEVSAHMRSGNHAAALSCCDRALIAGERDMAVLGGTELRHFVTRRLSRMADVGLRIVLSQSDPTAALVWAERLRANTVTFPPIRPPRDDILAAQLDELRAALHELDDPERARGMDRELRARSRALQHAVRTSARLAEGDVAGAPAPLVLAELRAILHGRTFIELVETGGRILRIAVSRDELEVADLAAAVDVDRSAGFLRRAVERALRNPEDQVSRALVDHSAAEFDDFCRFSDLEGTLVLSPTASLHATPWGVLPSLSGRSFSSVPSARVLIRSASAPLRQPGLLLAAGPNLEFAEREISALAAVSPDAVVLRGDMTTAANVAAAIPAGGVAHLACHGNFSAQHPMFSALSLADGPNFLYDVERWQKQPALVVLSACHAGRASIGPGEEALGFVASLLSCGVSNVVASALVVPDRVQLVAVMSAFHRGLAVGLGPGAALVHARLADPVLGGAFTCTGNG